MTAPRHLVPLVGACLASLACAQQLSADGFRGLQMGPAELLASCGSVSLSCEGTSQLSLYSGSWLTRPVRLELQASPLRDLRVAGSTVGFVGGARLSPEIGLFGQLGTAFGQSQTTLFGAQGASGAGLSYGLGLRWDFSPGASAVVGWEARDLRFGGGERESVKGARLGLQWRY